MYDGFRVCGRPKVKGGMGMFIIVGEKPFCAGALSKD
jgi:hypothetical protein